MASFKMEIDASPNVYYLAISAMQKCIRRSMGDEAVCFAYIAWKCNKYRLFCRLWTVMMEDCGRSELALRLMFEHTVGYSEFEPLELIVRAMADGPKDRNPFSLSYMLNGRLKPIFFLNALKKSEKHNILISLVSEWPDQKHKVYDAFNYKWDVENFEWVKTLSQRSDSWDWEKGGSSLPYFFHEKTYKKPLDRCNRVHQCKPCTMLDGFFPLESADIHTMPGKACCRIYSSKTKYSPDEVGNILFYKEGCLCLDSDPYNFNFFLLEGDMDGWSKYLKEDHSKLVTDMLGLREWILKKDYEDDLNKMKSIYEGKSK